MSDKTIAVDFDGVIHEYSEGFKGGEIYDKPVEGAFKTIRKLIDKGYEVVVFTTRENCDEVYAWCLDKSWEVDGVELAETKFSVTNKKPIAIAYIDDRGIRFTNWKDIFNYF